ncbi:MAG: hypothetical protein CMC15_17340 [Flavobacteriaceae bacterium]|jgi:hypothetical protein|nr:hypothetical protein [Flavobacteriaceae bacterium]|tara:strand:+ start:76 stop:399 length:324 start_codon:yes stop_codon:yes gene_type:complete
MNKLPTDNDVSDALAFLVATDEQVGQAHGKTVRLKETLKVVKARETPSHGTALQKEKLAYMSDSYNKALNDYANAITDEKILHAQRASQIVIIDVWRTLSANIRKSN